MDMKFKIYDGKTFEDLCKDIVMNQSRRKDQIELFISDLRPLIKNVNDAMVVVPLIKQYIDSDISSDEHLVRLATIFQRILSSQVEAEGSTSTGFLSDEEKHQLFKEAEKEIEKEIKSLQKDSSSMVVLKSFKKE